MRTKAFSQGLLVFGLLAAGLLMWAPPAAAADEIVFPRGFDGLIDRMYHDAKAAELQEGLAAGGGTAFSRFSVRLYGGYNHILAGDINEGSDGYFEYLEIYEALGIGTMTGAYKPLHGGLSFGGDVIYQITPNIGVGLGVGYLRNTKTSSATLADETGEITVAATPTVSAMPVKLGAFFTVPVAGKINLTADLGAALYTGLKLDALQRAEFDDESWQEMSFSGSRSSDIGFQGGLGFEYMFTPKMGFFVEAVGRYAKFKTFETVATLYENSDGYTETGEGHLYLETYQGLEEWAHYTMFYISEVEPVDDEYYTYTEPKIDLSGFSLQAGFRIRF